MVVPRYTRRVPELSVFCPLLEPFEPLELFGVSDSGRVAALDIPGAKPGAPCGIPFGGVLMFGPPIPGAASREGLLERGHDGQRIRGVDGVELEEVGHGG